MAKDPAYLFYSNDFLSGVMTMPFEDRGKYITILCLMHQQGRINEETIRFVVGSISDKLKSKFSIDEQGNWFNVRLELEIEKRSKFTDSRRENGKKGGRKPINEANGYPNAKPKYKPKNNHTKDIDESINENEDFKIEMPFNSDFFIQMWNQWKTYKKKQENFKYASVQSEQAALSKLSKLSKGDELIAIEIIKESMANGWKGFFELKNNNNAKSNQQSGINDLEDLQQKFNSRYGTK